MKALSGNLFFLRHFAESGYSINLDNKRIDIIDPKTKEVFIKGIHKKLYWIVEFIVNKDITQTVSAYEIKDLSESEINRVNDKLIQTKTVTVETLTVRP